MGTEEELERQIQSVEAHLIWLKRQRGPAPETAPVLPPETSLEASVPVASTPQSPLPTDPLPPAQRLGLQAKVGCIAAAVLLLILFLLLIFVLPQFLYD
ncbi:MAG: hypothetical protein ACFBZ8_05130 [Opitutales bacterium]